MRYIILKIQNIPKQFEGTAADLANILPTEGVWELDDEWQIYFKEDIYKNQSSQILEQLKHFLPDSISIQEEVFDDENVDWNEEWKKNYKPVEITSDIVIYPSWFDIREKDQNKITVKIDPQMGFGTGTHETTQLMVILLEKYLTPNMKILDMGTGSGILAIVAEKLFPSSDITGIEIDEDALENARLNGKLNECEKIQWIHGGKEQIPDTFFDLILANINRSVLLTMMDDFATHVKENGKIILSGILAEEKQIIMDACEQRNLNLLEEQQKNEWVAQVWTPMQS
jgi:ribosomal protein L11 methyltransferase